MKIEYDVIIIGAASAGLSAAIYTSRRNLKTLVIGKDLGGQASTTRHIENYPGFKQISGPELMKKFEEQVKELEVEIKYQEVEKIISKNKVFKIKTANDEYVAKAVILAFGKTPKNLNVPGEKDFQGKGISYCATCDAPLFKNKITAVVGGGNSALESALLLSEISTKVYLIHRRNKFAGFESLVEKVKQKKNIEIILETSIEKFKGNGILNSIVIKNQKTKKQTELKVSGVFVEVGSEVKTNLIKGLVKLNKKNYIIINNFCETFSLKTGKTHPGIFAAGDVTDTPFKQVVISAGEGAKAGLQAYNYIRGIKSGSVFADWGNKK